MNNNQRALLFYLPLAVLFMFAVYRFENAPLYRGVPQEFLPEGVYEIASKRCMEAGPVFDYSRPKSENPLKSKEVVRNMLFFDGIMKRNILVNGDTLTWRVENSECQLFVQEKIKQNSSGKLVTVGGSKKRTKPDGCNFSYSFNGKSYVDENLMNDHGELSLEADRSMSLLIFHDGTKFYLYDSRYSDYSEIGCSYSDKTELVLNKVL